MNGIELAQSFATKGFNYDKDTLFNFYVSLMTKPFVILTGISGSGKSKIAEIFAESMSNGNGKNYELIPIKPNWRDNKGLFGYHNVIDDNYYVTPLIRLFLKAINDPKNPYFIILDEMNIAQVEHYFADYLSLIESRRVEADNSGLTFDTFNFSGHNSLSEALILAAFDIGVDGIDRDIADYRTNRFCERWKKIIFTGQDTSWTPQVRTEFNQKDANGNPSRLAGRMFSGGNGRYHLKSRDELDPNDTRLYDELYSLYLDITTDHMTIKQDNIVLHNETMCLSGGTGSKCDCANCPYSKSEKYRCDKLWASDDDGVLVPPEMPIPLNVFTIGTVNVDETTYMFSPKVLDRGNVIEFNEVDFESVYDLPDSIKRLLSYAKLFYNNDYYFDSSINICDALKVKIPSVRRVNELMNGHEEDSAVFVKIFSSLKKYNMQFGYRVINEMSAYVNNAVEMSGNETVVPHAVDLQILQKILPKMHGSYEKLWNPLIDVLNCLLHDENKKKNYESIDEIRDFAAGELGKDECSLRDLTEDDIKRIYKYPKSASKLLDMIIDLDAQGFTTFIR